MITFMSDILCITNRKLCKEDFLIRIEKIAKAHPKAIILREKDLSEDNYKTLAKSVLQICKDYNTPCILHTFVKTAKAINCKSIHLPLPVLRTLSKSDKDFFINLGASCHSVEDATEAEKMGCTYITAGHIFDTDCKKGIPGRGVDFLKEVCKAVSMPVYALGGINAKNIVKVKAAGAKGACVMSGAMICEDAHEFLTAFKE